MQPLAYLAVRCLIGWIQLLECRSRAFISSSPVALTTGPVHCWSVVYALFIAIHLRTYRHIGRADYEEQLPLWAWWIESVTVCSTVIWWIASCILAFTRVVSDDMFGLPVSRYDAYTPKLLRVVLSRGFRDGLSVAHMASGGGLFVSVLFLACAMPLIPGELAVSEVCLALVAFVFALVLSVMAIRALRGDRGGRLEASTLGAAEEAAALGPQLCVLLTLANVPGQASKFERVVYLATTVAWGGSLVVCFKQPVKCAGMAMAPRPEELAVCFVLDAAAALTLIFCFPPLNTWPMWLLGAMLLLIGFLLTYSDLRDPLVELLEPIMPFRNDAGARFQSPVREALRSLSRGLALLCSLVVVWDIVTHIRTQPQPRTDPPGVESFPPGDLHDYSDMAEDIHEDVYPDKWSADSRLLLRWKASAQFPGEARVLELAAQLLDTLPERLASEHLFTQHRVFHFRFLGPRDISRPHYNVYEHWQELVTSPTGEMAELAESDFPAYLDAGLCLALPDGLSEAELAPKAGAEDSQEAEDPRVTSVHYTLKSIDGVDNRLAYAVACGAWRQRAFSEDYGAWDGPSMDEMQDHYRTFDEAELHREEQPPAQDWERPPVQYGQLQEGQPEEGHLPQQPERGGEQMQDATGAPLGETPGPIQPDAAAAGVGSEGLSEVTS